MIKKYLTLLIFCLHLLTFCFGYSIDKVHSFNMESDHSILDEHSVCTNSEEPLTLDADDFAPVITLSTSSMTGLDYVFGSGPSTVQTFTITATGLTSNLIITPPTDFEISINNTTYFSSGISLPFGSYTITVYVRLKAGLAIGTYAGTINAASTGATTQTVAVDGEVTAPPPCADLFISEYVEGSSNNKFLEIYNPTSSTINLTNYDVQIYFNGATGAGRTLALTGNIAPYDVFILAHNSALLGVTADQYEILDFNGNDAVALRHSGSFIDVIGQIGFDPGTEWGPTTGGFSGTRDATMVRNSNVQAGDVNGSDAFSIDSEWTSYAQNTVFGLGSHSSYCESPEPELQLVDHLGANQACGYTIDFGNVASDGSFTDLTFTIENTGASDLNISNLTISAGEYTLVSPSAPLTIASGASEVVTVRFTPSSNGTHTGTVTISSDDTDESTCTVNLTGVGMTPAPEIDVERNTGTSIPNGALANTGYNTVFAATVMGSSSAPKTFHVSSEGTTDLDLSTIWSDNPTEFSISLNPSPATIPYGTEVDFEITFSPTGIGTRTANIVIRNNDADEDPYTFAVQGTGECGSGALVISPSNGPVNTVVTVIGTDYGGSTTATMNGVPAAVNVISLSEIEVTIPAGATTGSLEVNNDFGCLSSALFTVLDEQIYGCQGTGGSTPTDLFISEITDHGSGSHSYVEIFNGTGATVNLTNYEIRIHNNGAATATSTIPLVGTVANNDVFVLAFGSTDATYPHAAHGADQTNNASGINEDDHIRLYNATTSTWVDLWGDTSGTAFTIASKNYTYRRKNSGITAPSTTWNPSDWDAFTPVDYSNIGFYDFSVGVPPSITVQPTAPSTSCDLTVAISVTAVEGFTGGNSLTYQWYYSAPGDSGWTMASNGALYSGVTNATLNVLNATLVDGYQYYCQVRENTATCHKSSNAVQLKVDDTTWDGSSWSDGAPDITTIAVLEGDYSTVTSGSFSACNLIITSGINLSIGNSSNQDYVEIQNNVFNKGIILIDSKSSLVQIADSGTFDRGAGAINTLTKMTAPLQYWYDYTYWSSPLENAQIETALDSSDPDRRYLYDATAFDDLLIEIGNTNTFTPGQDDIDDDGNDWVAQSSGSMTPGVGYAATHNNIGFSSGTSYSYVFQGDDTNNSGFNTGTISVDIYTNGAVYNNWNFIGNPYPSAISTDEFFADNSAYLEGVIYLWSHTTEVNSNNSGNQNMNFTQQDYAMINGMGGTGSTSDPGNIPNKYIPSGQGFFVIGNKAMGTGISNVPIFNNSMRVTGNNDQFFRNTNGGSERLWINLSSDNGVFNQILVGYADQATDGYDGMIYDAPRNLSTELYGMLYSIIPNDDVKYAIQGKSLESLTLDEIIPIGFKTTIETPTVFTLSIGQLEGDFMSSQSIYVYDHDLNLFHDLTISDYNFSSVPGEFNNRFDIVFQTNALSVHNPVLETSSLTIMELQEDYVTFSVPSSSRISQVEIIDLLGRHLYTLNGNHSKETYHLTELSSATYIAQVTLANGQVLTKKMIKK